MTASTAATHIPQRSPPAPGAGKRQFQRSAEAPGQAVPALATERNAAPTRHPPIGSDTAARLPCRYAWSAERLPGSQVLHLNNLILDHITGRSYRNNLALLLANQRPADRRGNRNLAFLDLCLVFSNQLVPDLVVGVDIDDGDRGAKNDLAGVGDARYINHLGRRQATLDVTDTRLDHALLLASGVVFGVLLQVSQLTRFGDGLGDLRAQYGFQVLELILKGLGALFCHRVLHIHNLSCRSCRQRTARSGPNFSAMQTA